MRWGFLKTDYETLFLNDPFMFSMIYRSLQVFLCEERQTRVIIAWLFMI